MDKKNILWPKDAIKIIDNIEPIKSFLEFKNEGDFYLVQIIRRKKDNPTSKSARNIKSYYIESKEHFDSIYDEIKKMCETFNARAYINVGRKNYRSVSMDMMAILSNNIRNGNFKNKKIFDSAATTNKSDDKYWIVDLDGQFDLDYIKSIIYNIRPIGDKIKLELPTKSGFHLICKPFDVKSFNEILPNIDVKKNTSTLLYFASQSQ